MKNQWFNLRLNLLRGGFFVLCVLMLLASILLFFRGTMVELILGGFFLCMSVVIFIIMFIPLMSSTKNKEGLIWFNVKLNLFLMILIATFILLLSIFMFFRSTIFALIFGGILMCMAIVLFISVFMRQRPYWHMDAYSISLALWAILKGTRISQDDTHVTLLNFFKKNNIVFEIAPSKKDYIFKCSVVYYIRNMDLFVGMTSDGFLAYSEKKNNKSLEVLKKELSAFIDEIK